MNKWIAVWERMPRADGYYIVCTKGGGVTMRGYFLEEGGFISNEPVTHWMNKPEPPKDAIYYE